MRERQELQRLIEEARLDLDQSLERRDDYEVFYAKSLFLDKLIEEYLDMKEKEKIFSHL